MNYKVQITKMAEYDLEEAMNYMNYVLKNPLETKQLFDDLEEGIGLLEDYPKIHAIIDDFTLKTWEIRFFIVRDYLAFYMIDESVHMVYVVRFLHTRRDWQKVLKISASEHNLV